ncbi:MAG: fumarylacetoacetate hydrolase family protein [Microbacterium sp.]
MHSTSRILAAERPAAERLAAERLARAARTGVACEPVSELIGPTDVKAAYRVQQALTERRIADGSRVVGRKIGLTSAAVQSQVGVDQPDFGVLFDDMGYRDGEVIPMGRLLQPKAEAEVAFRLRRDILEPNDACGVRGAVESAFAAIEIVDSRIADWRIGIADTVADNASSGVFVVASEGLSLDAFEPARVRMRMTRNGVQVSHGAGVDCMEDPLNALAWLAQTAIDVGSPLRAGDIVLSGALGPMVPIHPGDEFVADIDPLGTVTARFSRTESS